MRVEPEAGEARRSPGRARAGALVVLSSVCLFAPAPARSEAFSHAAFDTVLARHLHDGRVDYRGIAGDRGPLERYLAACAAARPDDWSRAEQLAFWVDAYNARVIDGVVRRPGLKSVLDTGRVLGVPTLAFFRERRPTAGRRLSLNDIEHGILRERFREPRVHFVLNCASASCPALPERALAGATLEADLERATARFLADSTLNRLDSPGGPELSSIFKWYGEDFGPAGGVLGFVAKVQPGRFAPGAPVRFLPYDWSLNGSW